MKKRMFAIALAIVGLSTAHAGDFDGLRYESELGTEAMAAIDGQMFKIIVPFNSKGSATVITHEKGDYCTYTVPVTTVAKAANPANPPKNNNKEYVPVPLPVGSYSLSATKAMSNSSFGTGIKIEANVTTPYKNSTSTFKANDFFVHQTPYQNTWGCAGISNNSGNGAEMTKVLNSYSTSTGTKTISVSPPASVSSPASASLGSFFSRLFKPL
jgi:hypothetical protein